MKMGERNEGMRSTREQERASGDASQKGAHDECELNWRTTGPGRMAYRRFFWT